MSFSEAAANSIAQLAREVTAVHRCDGSAEEVFSYRAGSREIGWRVRGAARRGDLLVGVTQTAAGRRVVNLNRVEGVRAGYYLWEPASDVPVTPGVRWDDVLARMSRRVSRTWVSLTGDDARDFIDALCREIDDRKDTAAEEGRARLRNCRERSRKNRYEAIERSEGECSACGLNLRVLFGSRGDRGLEVHHIVPLVHRPTGTLRTRVSDLAVLCATCHRLLHADPRESLEALIQDWSMRQG